MAPQPPATVLPWQKHQCTPVLGGRAQHCCRCTSVCVLHRSIAALSHKPTRPKPLHVECFAGLWVKLSSKLSRCCRGHRHTPQMDMYSVGVLLFVMLTGCKPIPSAICTKLSYDRLETADYPGVKMQQFRRLSTPARELVLSLMARRPADRPCAMATLAHPWVAKHAERWRAAGVDLTDLALPASELNDAVRRAPRVDELVARARAQRPLPPSATSKTRGSERSSSSRTATPTRRPAPVDVSERGTQPASSTAGAITPEAGQENAPAPQRHRHRSRHATTPTAAATPTSPAPVTSGIPARPPLARQASTAQSPAPTASSPIPRHGRGSAGTPSAHGGASTSMHIGPSGGSLTAANSGLGGGDARNRGTPLRRDISNALSDTIDNILDLIQQQSGTTSACAPAGTPCGSAFTGPLTPAMHPGVWGSQFGGLARMRSRSGSLPMHNGDSTHIQGGGSSFVLSSAIPNAPLHEGAAAVSTTPGSTPSGTPLSPAHGMVESMSGKVSAVPSRSINRALSAVFQAAESVADADYVRSPHLSQLR